LNVVLILCLVFVCKPRWDHVWMRRGRDGAHFGSAVSQNSWDTFRSVREQAEKSAAGTASRSEVQKTTFARYSVSFTLAINKIINLLKTLGFFFLGTTTSLKRTVQGIISWDLFWNCGVWSILYPDETKSLLNRICYTLHSELFQSSQNSYIKNDCWLITFDISWDDYTINCEKYQICRFKGEIKGNAEKLVKILDESKRSKLTPYST
jgi:hypothetical protein